ncbi:hypothetical protein FH972_021791 [Carpinus fangiana]|uniref:Uncharacterized protein n=1 Tax=Carpinus fangiana TaxID=176857 RepID=A0A5N6KQP9_9ROSI|nr:hypothetical protein FH972_021791 [Carpinus fangiana]
MANTMDMTQNNLSTMAHGRRVTFRTVATGLGAGIDSPRARVMESGDSVCIITQEPRGASLTETGAVIRPEARLLGNQLVACPTLATATSFEADCARLHRQNYVKENIVV